MVRLSPNFRRKREAWRLLVWILEWNRRRSRCGWAQPSTSPRPKLAMNHGTQERPKAEKLCFDKCLSGASLILRHVFFVWWSWMMKGSICFMAVIFFWCGRFPLHNFLQTPGGGARTLHRGLLSVYSKRLFNWCNPKSSKTTRQLLQKDVFFTRKATVRNTARSMSGGGCGSVVATVRSFKKRSSLVHLLGVKHANQMAGLHPEGFKASNILSGLSTDLRPSRCPESWRPSSLCLCILHAEGAETLRATLEPGDRKRWGLT